jgi:outer membrane protein assembly factor BamB
MVATSYANTPNYVNVFVSHDSGVTWNSNILQTLNWAEASSAASSADGNTLVAVINGGGIYTWHAPGTVLWTYDAVGSGIFASPALAPDGTVYLATGAGLTAVTNAGSTGLNKWTGHSFGGSPSVGTDGTIYLANGSFLFAVNPDGSKKWSYPVQGGGTPAIGADGTIYLEGYFGLYAVTPSGSLKWQAQISGTGQYSSPVVGPDGTIYAASFEGVEVFAFNVDGSRKWVSNLVSGPLDAPALLPNGTLLVSAGALDAFGTDGTMLWSVGQSLGSAPVIGPANTVYVSSVYRDLLAVDPVSHKTLWDFVVSGVPQYGTVTTPAVDAQGSVYFCVSNSVWALSPAGLVQWSMTADQQPLANNDLANSSPVIGGDGTLYVAIGSKLYAIATGANGPANSSWPMYQQNARHTGKIERPFLEAPQQRTDTNFTFLLYPNQLGLTYTIESSTNLSTWTTVTNVLATTLPTEVIDLTASNAPTRFYRASVTTN